MEETSNKVISLATAAFDPSDKERHDVLIRVVQCTKYILDENHHNSSQAIATLLACGFHMSILSRYMKFIYISKFKSTFTFKFARKQNLFKFVFLCRFTFKDLIFLINPE